MDQSELVKRFDYHPPLTDDVKLRHEAVRSTLKSAAAVLVQLVPEGREQSLMVTAIEEAMMWANAGIARTQPQRPDADTLAKISACPTPVYHETHRYCPSCPWTEQLVIDG